MSQLNIKYHIYCIRNCVNHSRKGLTYGFRFEHTVSARPDMRRLFHNVRLILSAC